MLNVECRIELRPEAIGADKDFKNLRTFKDFSDGGDRREWLRCSMGAMGMMGEPGDIGAMGMMGAMGLMGMVMDEMGAMWERCGNDVGTMWIMAWPGEIRELGHSEGSECGYL